ncbi:MAG: DUF1549 and DUF1553 domain-containing protein [Gemmataceae bacterium]|nr:DUF1549 and DUF1553 domain-containing protein [Gemmataceae bacterium]
MRLERVILISAIISGAVPPGRAGDDRLPLHQKIDRAIAGGKADFNAEAAPRCFDAEFLRRITLDLAGTIPTADEVRVFLADSRADKRAALADRLLASPAHARHMAGVLDVMLMERRSDKYVKTAEWKEYLRDSVAANKPWDQLVREILSADGADSVTRPAAKFYLDRLGEPNLITRDIGRLFLGMNLACAQCHDHPRVDHYRQADYYGIYAFLNRTFLFNDPKTKQTVLAEKGEGDVTFVSVFDRKKVLKGTGPHMPERPPVKEPVFAKGEEYEVSPTNQTRPVPKFSRRARLAAELTDPRNRPFRRNIVNRLWAHMMGRGLVDPVDLHHPDNPPSHPELLDLLADDFAASKYDLRRALRELALSQTYQRSSEQPDGQESAPESFAVFNLKPLTPEQLAWSLMQASSAVEVERAALRVKDSEQAFQDRLAQQAAPVVRAFAGPPGQAETLGFQATTNQALLLANGEPLRTWLTDRPGSLLHRLGKLRKSDEVAEELYLSVLTRRPSAEDCRTVANYLAARNDDRLGALRDLAWALMVSAEFRFNH